jgi:branched-subunit amino acid ABC-type transport system permease component
MLLDILTTSGVLLLVVLGLGLILGLLDVINLAHTGLMAIGVYAAISSVRAGLPFPVAVLAGGLAAGMVGAIIERFVVRRLYGRPLDTILATWGISLIIAQAIAGIYGRGPQVLTGPLVSAVWFGYPAYRLMLLTIAVLLTAGLWLLARVTPSGLVARIVMANEPLARGLGINVVLVRQVTFVSGAGLAGLAGALVGPVQGVSPNFGLGVMVPAFLAVLLSGRSLPGLVIACLALGSVQTVFSFYLNPVYATVAIVAAAVALLRAWPDGLVWRRGI